MAAIQPQNPRPFLSQLVGSEINVRLKWSEDLYRGRLVSVDSYMNIQLSDCEEVSGGDGENKTSLGSVLIRCNNVLWINSASGMDTS